jgi:hypothetical protein
VLIHWNAWHVRAKMITVNELHEGPLVERWRHVDNKKALATAGSLEPSYGQRHLCVAIYGQRGECSGTVSARSRIVEPVGAHSGPWRLVLRWRSWLSRI